MMKTLYLAVFVCSSMSLTAQSQFQTTYGNSSASTIMATIQQDSAYFLFGNHNIGTGNSAIYLSIVDTLDGSINNTYTYSGIADDYLNKAVRSGGYFYLLGGTFSSGAGGSDVLFMKLDSLGNIVFANTYGDSLNEEGTALLNTQDGNFLIAASIEETISSDIDILLIKVDPLGNVIWSNRISGDGHDQANALIELKASGFALAGFSTSTGTVLTDGLLLKTDTNGLLVSASTFGGLQVDYFNSLGEEDDGDINLAGATNSFNAINLDAWIMSVTSAGNIKWSSRFGSGAGTEIATQLISAKKEMSVCGTTTGLGTGGLEIFYCSWDTAGGLKQFGTYGGSQSDDINGMVFDQAGSLLLHGNTSSFDLTGQHSFLIKANGGGESACAYFEDFPANNNVTSSIDTAGLNFTTDTISLNTAAAGISRSNLTLMMGTLNYPYADFDHSANGLSVTFQDRSTISLLDTIIWHFGDGSDPDTLMRFPLHNYDSTGTYSVCLEVWNNCGYDSICKEIYVCSGPLSSFTWSLIAGTHTIDFTGTSVQANDWQWDFGDGDTSVVQNPSHTFAGPGTYKVCLTNNNLCGFDTACQELTLFPIGIEEAELRPEMSIHPNPASDYIFINTNIKSGSKAELNLYNMSGVLLHQVVLNDSESKTMQLAINRYPTGLYQLQLITEQLTLTRKLVLIRR